MGKNINILVALLLAVCASGSQAANLWIIGDAAPYGWSLDDATALLSTTENESLYTGTIYLKADAEFKFMTTTDWGGTEYGAAPGESIENGLLTLASGKNDEGYGKIKVAEDANYFITVDTQNLKATIVKSEYQETNIGLCSLFLVGDATAGGWSVDNGTPLFQKEDTPYVYSADVALSAGSFKIATTIKGGGTWDSKYYYFRDPADSGKIILGNNEDTQWSISKKGIYTVTVNVNDNSISIQWLREWNEDDLPIVTDIHKYKAPLYWSVYEYCYELEKRGVNLNDMDISSQKWDEIIDWVATELKPYGYDMVCTDGFIPMLAKDDSGYMTHYGSVSLKDLVAKCREKGLKLGVYDNPLWIHGSLDTKVQGTDYTFRTLTYNGSNPVVNPDVNDKWFTWAVSENPGTREYIDGFFKHYADLGVKFIRIDFLSWYEDGKDRNMGTVGKGYGRESYRRALSYIAEAADKYGVFTSLVMPHLYEDAEIESTYGNMVRIVADTSDGGWNHCSDAEKGKSYSTWPNCMNMFDGFTYWSHISGRDKVILDGDFTRLNTFSSEAERRSVISLQLMAGGPIAVADQNTTIGNNLKYYTNEELLELNKDRFVGRPLSLVLGQDSQMWFGRLSSGDYVIGFFNRAFSQPKKFSQSLADLGISGEYSMRDLWTHTDEGTTSSTIEATVSAHGCKILKLTESTAAIEDIKSIDVENSEPEYFTLTGIKVASPESGIYLKKQGEKVTKLLIK